MKLGDTFVWCPTGGIDHLWILISDPAANGGDCVVVNLTDSSHGKFSYTLRPGQHRYIYKDSDVNFGDNHCARLIATSGCTQVPC